MKALIVILVIFALVGGASIGVLAAVTADSEELVDILDDARSLAWDGKIAEAVAAIEKLRISYEKKEPFLNLVLNHSELDNVNELLFRARSYLENGELNDFYAELSALRHLLYHLRELERVTVSNVL